MSIEAIAGSHKPFDPRIHDVRSQLGQRVSANRILSHLKDSQINESHEDCQRVQDAYSFRCAPQVHGAVIDVVKSIKEIAISDVNSATDNPLILEDGNGGYDVLSGGNFHGEPLALAADNLAAAIHEICSISERRTNQMLMPSWSGLPAYLAKNSGLESGLMIVQYVSAAAIARIRLLASPAALTNIPVSGGKEDHVSMGSTACQRLEEICRLAASVLGNEMLVASAALDLREHEPGKGVQNYHEMVRSVSDPINGDRSMSRDTNRMAEKILNTWRIQMSQTRRHLEHHPGINPAPFKATIESVTDEGVILSDSWCYPKGGAAGGHGDLPIRWRRIRFGEVSASSHCILHPVSSGNLQVGQ